MSAIGPQPRRAGAISHEAAASPAKTPYRLLWSVGIVVGLLTIFAFVLWGINGPQTLFDLMAAFCT
jgi:hypothetical protein